MEHINRRICDYLEKNNIKSSQLCEILGLKKSPLTDWKNKHSRPTLTQIIAICENFGILEGVPEEIKKCAEATVKYEGYLKKNAQQIEKAKKLEEKALPADIDYDKIKGLRLEAREQLKRVRPLTLGQAGRIYGVNPADVTVLIVWLATKK